MLISLHVHFDNCLLSWAWNKKSTLKWSLSNPCRYWSTDFKTTLKFTAKICSIVVKVFSPRTRIGFETAGRLSSTLTGLYRNLLPQNGGRQQRRYGTYYPYFVARKWFLRLWKQKISAIYRKGDDEEKVIPELAKDTLVRFTFRVQGVTVYLSVKVWFYNRNWQVVYILRQDVDLTHRQIEKIENIGHLENIEVYYSTVLIWTRGWHFCYS